MLAVGGQIGRKRRGGVEHLDVAGTLVERALEQLGQSAEVVRAEHDIEMRERLEGVLSVSQQSLKYRMQLQGLDLTSWKQEARTLVLTR